MDLKKNAKSQRPGMEHSLKNMASATHLKFYIKATKNSSLSIRSSTPPLPGLESQNFAVARFSCFERLVLSSCCETPQVPSF